LKLVHEVALYDCLTQKVDSEAKLDMLDSVQEFELQVVSDGTDLSSTGSAFAVNDDDETPILVESGT
jgi:hypothetical protein